MKKSPLNAVHVALGARMVEFSGWLMPVQYSGIIAEHRSVRTASGLFDISHMGNVIVEGPQAAAWLDSLLTNSVQGLEVSRGQYTLMLNETGGVIDDLILYRTGEESFHLVINASRIDEDIAWMQSRLGNPAEARLQNCSNETAGLALQGPDSEALLQKSILGQGRAAPLRNQWITVDWEGYPVSIARTGYTGEDGFELFLPAEGAEKLWSALTQAGVTPCGLGARDSLRLEAGLPLNGHELSPSITPLEAGLSRFVALGKACDFPGKSILCRDHSEKPKRQLASLLMAPGSPPPRSDYTVSNCGLKVGVVTSGLASPTLGRGIAFALIDAASAAPGTPLSVEIRGKSYPAEVVSRPFYKRPKKASA